MKYLYSLLFLVFYMPGIHSQCPLAQDSLDINEVNVGLLSAGDMFWDQSDARYEVPKGSGVNAVFAGSLWFGGVDEMGTLRVAAATYRQANGSSSNSTDFYPGPALENPEDQEALCASYDRFWKVNRSDIESFQSAFLNGEISEISDVPASLSDWPGRNSPYFNFLFGDQGEAPFVDVNDDGIYDPLDGDYPDVPGDQAVWWIYNDQKTHEQTGSVPMGIQVGVTAYAYTQEPLQYTTFYKYNLLNASSINYQDFFIGQWLDIDLGCFENDYVGCSPEENLAYAYNGKSEAETCPNGYGEDLPIVAWKIMEGPLDDQGQELGMHSFRYYGSDFTVQGNPQEPNHYYYYLKGTWLDDVPMTYGGNGYGGTEETLFMFPSNPSESGAEYWSECSIETDPYDRKFLASMGPFALPANATKSFTFAIIWSNDNQDLCPDITGFAADANEIKDLHEQILAEMASGISEENDASINLKFYPNPMEDQITFNWSSSNFRADVLSIHSLDGKLQRMLEITDQNQLVLPRGNLTAGIYVYALQGEGNRVFTGKFIVE